MTNRRAARIAQAIREVVSTSVLHDLRDPRIKNVTVVRVEAATDLRSAKVYVSVLGDDKIKARSLQGLNSSCGFLQSKIGDRLQTRYTPTLRFELDDPSKETPSMQVGRILDELAKERGDVESPAGDSGESAEVPAVDEDDSETESADVNVNEAPDAVREIDP